MKRKRPTYLEATRRISKRSYVIVTSSLLALVIAVLSWLIPSPPFREFLQWLFIAILSIFVLVLISSTVIYIIQMFQYVSRLEQKISQIRGSLLALSGIDDVEPGSELRYSIASITDEQGTVNLVVELAENPGLRQGSRLDVVVSVTGEVWGHVEVAHLVEKQAWAHPIDRRNPEFWERLEDRMKSDPSPPPGVHLEPTVPPEIRQLLYVVEHEEGE